MATCKKCVHYDVCHKRQTSISLDPMKCGYKCPDYKDKEDFVRVVRCKGCTHYKNEWCEILKAETPIADGFCCYGKKKEGTE